MGFPCNQFGKQEPGGPADIRNFVDAKGVKFQMFQKVEVNGKHAHPVFQYLKANLSSMLGQSLKWNFTKFLVDRKGKPIKRYSPGTSPMSIRSDILKLLEEGGSSS